MATLTVNNNLANIAKDSKPFKHRQIDGDEMRLPKPILDGQSGELSFAVNAFRRSQTPPYFALSYVWGTQEATEEIRLDDHPFPTRPNLHAFLRSVLFHFRTKFARGYFAKQIAPKIPPDGIYLWVDAIYLDQSYVEERTHQVRYMDSIFADAECVLSWLGEEEDHQTVAQDGSMFAPFSPFAQEPGDSRFSMQHITSLANCPYWYRRWVVQEYMLSQSRVLLDPIICIGSIDFEAVFWYCMAPRESAVLPFMYKKNLPSKSAFIQELLFDNRHCKFSDPRVKVYSFLGLVGTRQAVGIRRFLPNYNLSLGQVLIITLAVIREFECESHELWWKSGSTIYSIFSRDNVDKDSLVAIADAFRALYPLRECVLKLQERGNRGDMETVHTTKQGVRKAFEQARSLGYLLPEDI